MCGAFAERMFNKGPRRRHATGIEHTLTAGRCIMLLELLAIEWKSLGPTMGPRAMEQGDVT